MTVSNYIGGSKTKSGVDEQRDRSCSSPRIVTSNSEQLHETRTKTISVVTELNHEVDNPVRQQSSDSDELPDTHKVDSVQCHDNQSTHNNHLKGVAAERDTNSSRKPSKECQATSRQVLTPTSDKEKVSGRTEELKECTNSWNEIVPGIHSCAAVASSNSFLGEVDRENHNHANIEELSSPQHSRAELLPTEAENEVALQPKQRQLPTVLLNGDDREDELISPEARALISDEILKECQRSSSSFASSSVANERETETVHDSIIQQDSSLPEKQAGFRNCAYTDSGMLTQAQDNKSADVENKNFSLDNDLRAASSERELSAKSSCIFVDMSSLNLDQVQEDESID